jgi:hypothetical protein
MNYLALLAAAITLTGCASASRMNPEDFTTLRTGRIPEAAVPGFTTCVMDGFDAAHQLADVSARQQRRENLTRVETSTGGRLLLVSADIFDDGRVALLEAKSGALLNTSAEVDAFDRCLRKHRQGET